MSLGRASMARMAGTFWLIGLVASAAGCAPTSSEIAAMDPQRIREIRAIPLCYAYAREMKKGLRPISIQQEITRRKIDCTEEVEEIIEDCSALRIVSTKPHPVYQNVRLTMVRNDSNRTKRFRILADGRSSAELQINPLTTEEFGVVSSQAGQMMSAFGGRTGERASLHDCFSKFPVTEATQRRSRL